MSLLVKAGITKLSELEIDADKDWDGKGISNIKEIAEAMAIGHIIQHNGTKLVKLQPGAANLVLTSEGPGKAVLWAPGGTYFYRYFPVQMESEHSAGLFAPDHSVSKLSPLTAPYGAYQKPELDSVNPDWFRLGEKSVALDKAAALFSPDNTRSKDALASTTKGYKLPVGGAVADDGTVEADETSEAQSGPALYQNCITGDTVYESIYGATWRAQTFTTVNAHRIRYAKLKLYRYGYPGTVTVSIRAVDGEGHPTGGDLCSGTIDGNYFTADSSGRWYKFDFGTGYNLDAATKYAIVVRAVDGTSANCVRWRENSANPYATGNTEKSTTSGTSWTADTTSDLMFEEWGTTNDMTLLPAAPEVGDRYDFGYLAKFPKLWLDIGQAGEGIYSIEWQYWNGAWAALAVTDNTIGFTVLGTNYVSFTPPADWVAHTIQGMNIYWISARCSAYTPDGYVQPLGTWAKIERDI